MKKFVFASVMALASLSLVPAPTLRAQDQPGTIQIKDPAEFNAYQMATTQSDPKAKAAALDDFITKYPQSVAKKAVLDMLLDAYQQTGDQQKTVDTAKKVLQVDPNNLKAIYITAFIEKGQCAKTSDQATCDDAAAMAQKGLTAPKPAGVSDDDFKKQTDATYPFFHSVLAVDDIIGKKDPKAAVDEYTTELKSYPVQATTQGSALGDTLQLALAYVKLQLVDAQAARDAQTKAKAAPGDAAAAQAAKAANDKANQDYLLASWFFARAWSYAPANFKSQIEPQLEYYFKKYHGDTTGLDQLKTQAAASLFPPANLSSTITPAKTPKSRSTTSSPIPRI